MDYFDLTVLLFTLFIFIFGSFFNTVVLLVYLKFHRNYPSIVLLVSVSLVGFLSSFIIVPYVAISELKFIRKSLVYCQIYMFFLCFTSAIPVHLLFLIASDRFKIISQSIGKNIKFEFNSICTVMISASFVLLVICIPVVFYAIAEKEYLCKSNINASFDYVNISGTLIINIISAMIYFKIFLIVHRKNIFMPKISTVEKNLEETNKSMSQQNKLTRRDWKMVKMFILVRQVRLKY